MPWFSRKKKRKQKNVVVNTVSRDDGVLANTAKPTFAVVVQNFQSSVSEQISVERGQVVEALFTEEDWIYVRNVNGNCGYIPGSFCFPLERLRMGLPEAESESERVSQVRAHPRPTTIHVDTFECPLGDGGGREGGECVEEEEVNSPDSGISCSHQASSSNMESVHSLRNTRERLTVDSGSRHNFEHSDSHQQAVIEGAEPERGHAHLARHPERRRQFMMPNSSLPLLETAPLPNMASVPHSPSPPPLQPVTDTPGHTHITMATIADEDEHQSNSDGDDVFLPESNRPVGIYQCAETYEPRFEGEIPLQRDEVVVVLEAGRGEWVLAMGSEGKEGLVLKSLLHKYRPELPEDAEEEEVDIGEEVHSEEMTAVQESERASEAAVTGDSEILTSSSATQTELIIDGVIHELTSSAPPRPHPTTAGTASLVATETTSVSIQTEFTLPNWFKNNTPVATPNNTLTRSSAGSCTQSQTVTADTSPHPHQPHNSHSPGENSPPPRSSAPQRLLCNPRSSRSSSAAAGENNSAHHSGSTSPHPSRSPDTPANGVRPPNGRGLPLTPASAPPPPSVAPRTPSGDRNPRALVSSPQSVPNTGEEGREATATTAQPRQRLERAQCRDRETTAGVGVGQGRAGTAAQVTAPRWTGTMQRHRQALQQHARIINSIRFDPDNEASSAHQSSARRRMQPTPIVTATRDYSPPQRARNALVLRRGEIMYAQPNVPFPHGWIWVYHTLHKKYGYVPKDHIAYMYLVQKDQGATLEDIV